MKRTIVSLSLAIPVLLGASIAYSSEENSDPLSPNNTHPHHEHKQCPEHTKDKKHKDCAKHKDSKSAKQCPEHTHTNKD